MAAATTKQKQLTPVQRAAAVVIALGADRASEVYRYLKDDEVEQISLEIAKLNRLSPEDMQSTIEDFYGLCVTQKVITEGGVLYAKDILEKAGVNPDTRVKDLTDAEEQKLRDVIDNYIVEGDLRRQTALDIKRLSEIGCYRGMRHRKGLPVRGQRSKTNARTRKGPKKTIANKKK